MSWTFKYCTVLCLCGAANLFAEDRYSDIVREDQPVAWWRFDGSAPENLADASGNSFTPTIKGGVTFAEAGPRPSEYPDFEPTNTGALFPTGPNYLVVADPGDSSALDFTNGDAITLEAWLRLDGPLGGSFPYIVGKGRTHNPGVSEQNQNYSLRLATQNRATALSFFFVDAETTGSIEQAGHRWTSTEGVPDDGAWHHVAVTYVFGQPKSLRGYIDGSAVPGKWDMAGETEKPPVVDNDELWIGSAMAGGSTLGGALDEVAIYRTALTPERIKLRANVNYSVGQFAFGKVDPATVPTDKVRVEIVERIPVSRKWSFRMNQEPELLYETDVFALKTIPPKYDRNGLIIDRPIPSLLHLVSSVQFAAGEYEFILRSLDASRLYIDGEMVAETKFKRLGGDAHHPYYQLPKPESDMLSIPAGHEEQRVTISLTAGRHTVSLYRLLGNKGHGQHLGEMVIGYARPGEPFRMLAPVRDIPFTDAGWLAVQDEDRVRQRNWNQQLRLANSAQEREYWDRRHAYARDHVAIPPVTVPPGDAVHPIDRLLLQRLAEQGQEPTELVDDFAFLRRLSLDTTGRIPTPEMLQAFLADPAAQRRELAIDRLLHDAAWADHWVSYWQDALAENPGLTKPELNNTGPFRWFLYEAMLDNMPLDRFAAELAMMRGSAQQGGPAGFSIASQNDVPMAAKAHILGTAFLAVEMKCARCHDAPYHDVAQEDLFGMAAMLKRGPEEVPGTSSIPVDPERLARMVVKVTLPAGSSVKPNWAFQEFVSLDSAANPLPSELVRNPEDTRERLAAMLTSPGNERFPRVLANRVWQRFFGRALIEPVDDWETAECLQPDLLDFLARELVTHNYDLKYLSRLILTSNAYQRRAVAGLHRESTEAGWFRGPIPRKLTGEQLTDSLYLATGKSFGAEELTMDGDGNQNEGTFGHLGIPQRAWQLAAVSNERDRPSMALPVAQSVNDLLGAFGWRQQRQEPLTARPDPLTALQPMALAYGTAPNRVIDYSDSSRLTELALRDQPLEQFVEDLFQTLLTRSPVTAERELLVELLKEGYADRIIAGPEVIQPKRIFRSGITWATHFSPEADAEAVHRQREIQHGDAPTLRLQADWRARAEDATWAIINSPEFVFVP